MQLAQSVTAMRPSSGIPSGFRIRFCGPVIAVSLISLLLTPSRAYSQSIPGAGNIGPWAGTGVQGCSGSVGAATSAKLNQPMGVRVDGSGNVYFADYACATVSKVTPSGTITTVAGSGVQGDAGDGGAATSARLDYPQDVAIDSSGNLYIADSGNNVVRKVSTSGTISTVAGNGNWGYSGNNGYPHHQRACRGLAQHHHLLGGKFRLRCSNIDRPIANSKQAQPDADNVEFPEPLYHRAICNLHRDHFECADRNRHLLQRHHIAGNGDDQRYKRDTINE